MKKTALNTLHQKHGAKIIDYSGWAMPLVYSTIIEEHLAVRQGCGIFDVSHMGEFLFEGKDAVKVVNLLISNDLAKLQPMQSLYSPLLYENGTFVDDVIVYLENPEKCWMVVNAANIDKDYRWIETQIDKMGFQSIAFSNLSEEKSLIAIQGKNSKTVIDGLFPHFGDGKMFSFDFVDFNGMSVMVCRTGYTGENGVEVMLPHAKAAELFQQAIELGATPCGLGARDTLRLEKGYSLYGQEITDKTNALEAGLGWTVSFEKDFIGKEALLQAKADGLQRKISGYIVEDRGVVRNGAKIFAENDEEIGYVTSGIFSPSLKKSIGMCYLPRNYSGKIAIEVRGRKLAARLCKRTFL